MSSARSDDVWGPACRLVGLFADLRSQTVQSTQPTGIGKLYNRVNLWATDSTMQADVQQLPKNRIEQLLVGAGRPPNWNEAVTLARALHFFAVKAGSSQGLDESALRTIVEVTHSEPPRELEIAEHFARKVLEWGQQHVVECVTQSLEKPSRMYGSPERREQRQMKASMADLRVQEDQPALVIEGSVALAHINPAVPVCYRDVYDRGKLGKIKDILEWSGLIRPGGHSIDVDVQHLETGVRLLVAIYQGGYYIKAFVVIEALSSGSIGVYFRWIPTVSEGQHRIDRLLKWGVSGAARLCLHIHEILGVAGRLNACIVIPEEQFWRTYRIPRLLLPDSDRWPIDTMMTTYLRDSMDAIAKARDGSYTGSVFEEF